MPEELPLEKKEEVTDYVKKIKGQTWIAIIGGIIFIWFLWQSGAFEGMNLLVPSIAVIIIAYLYFHSKKEKTPRGIIEATVMAEEYINFKQNRNEIPKGEFRLTQDKRKRVGKELKGYYFVAEVETTKGLKTFMVAVDPYKSDIILTEPKLGGVVSISDEVKDIEPEKREVLFEEEVVE